MLRVGVLVSGGGTNLQALIDANKAGRLGDVEISLICSNRKQAYALQRGLENDIPTVCLRPIDFPDKEAFTTNLIKVFVDHRIDLVVMAGYLVVLEPGFIKHFENKIINIHPSLIPSFCGHQYYGLKVHESALERGVKLTGATVHFVDEGTDTGPIILQKAVEVLEDDTPEVLQKRVMEQAEWVILPQAVRLIADGKIMIQGNKVMTKMNK